MDNAAATGKYFLNGKDLYTMFGVVPAKGASDGFLEYPERKPGITHDWPGINGIDHDVTRMNFKDREISMPINFLAKSEAGFWMQYEGLMAEFAQPGLQRLTITELKGKSFFVFYKSCTALTRFGRILDQGTGQYLVGIRYNLTVVEPDPQITSDEKFLVDEDGRFLVT